MGLKDFSKMFRPTGVVPFSHLAGKRIAFDAMTELYRAALGAKNIKACTDAQGNPTFHIMVMLSVVNKIADNNVEAVWVFDHNPEADMKTTQFHNQAKIEELKRRKERKSKAQEDLKSLAELTKKSQGMFGDLEEAERQGRLDEVLGDIEEKTQQAEKRAFGVNSSMIEDIQFIFDCLNISYVEAPAGFEGEQICALMCKAGLVDAVYSGDSDPVAFGAHTLYRYSTRDKKIYRYTQEDILNQLSLGTPEIDEDDEDSRATLDDFLKLSVILGTDFCGKTPRVGPKTVMKKYVTIDLTEAQLGAVEVFRKSYDVGTLHIISGETPQFTACNPDVLIAWLTETKMFDLTKAKKRLGDIMDLEANAPHPLSTKKSTRKKSTRKSPAKKKSPAPKPPVVPKKIARKSRKK
jgi:5'-3' exonuclease